MGTINNLQLTLQLQSNSGANRNVTNDKSLLQQYKHLQSYSISGINDDPSANISCIGYGFMPWTSNQNKTILINVLHFPNCWGTIVSPTAIVTQFIHHYQGWNISTDCDTGIETLRLLYRNGIQSDEFHLYIHNDLFVYGKE